MSEFTIGGDEYRITGQVPVMAQDKLVRRLSPVLASTLTAMRPNGAKDYSNAIAALVDNADVLATAFANISDADADYIIETCCYQVAVKREKVWSPVAKPGVGIMFDDLTLSALYQIVGKVLADSLGPFFREFLSMLFPPEETNNSSES